MAVDITNPSSEIDCLAAMWLDLLPKWLLSIFNVAEAGCQAGNTDADDLGILDVCRILKVSDSLI